MSHVNNEKYFTLENFKKIVKSKKLDGIEHCAEELLVEFSNDFLEELIELSCIFAETRKSESLEECDLQMALDYKWKLNVFPKNSGDNKVFEKKK